MATKITNSNQINQTPLLGSPKINFKNLDSYYTTFFEDDYAHKDLLALRYKGFAPNFLFNASGNFNFIQSKTNNAQENPMISSEKPMVFGETKLVNRLSDKIILETRLDSNGYIRLWSNFGTYAIGLTNPVEFSAKLKTTSDFNILSGFLQTNIFGKKYAYYNRIDKKRNNEFLLNEKISFTYRNLHFNACTKMSLANFTFRTYNALLAYETKKYDIIAQHVSDRTSPNIHVGELSLATYFRHKKHLYGIRIGYRPNNFDESGKMNAVIGGIFNPNNLALVKAKIDHTFNLAMSVKFKCYENLNVLFGTNIDLANPGTYFSDRAIPIPIGIKLEFLYQIMNACDVVIIHSFSNIYEAREEGYRIKGIIMFKLDWI